MSQLWVVATLLGSAGQVLRNIAQSGLTGRIGTLGATQVRFLYGLPFAALFLLVVHVVSGEAVPALTWRTVWITGIGALAQIGGTATMLSLMRRRSFAITTAWLKTEPVLIAVFGVLILHETLSPLGLLGICVATAGVILTVRGGVGATMRPGRGDLGAVAAGLGAAALFGMAAIGFRAGILSQPSGSFLMRATATLVLSLVIQSAVLALWMLAFDRKALLGSFGVLRGSLAAGFLGAAASEFWFIGFSLTTAANVRTLALVEVIFAQAIGTYWLGQKVAPRQLAGMAVIVVGVAILLRAEL